MLISDYAGQEIRFMDIYESHSIGRPFLKRHYKEVLLKLEEDGIIEVFDHLKKKRRNGTLADRLTVRFK